MGFSLSTVLLQVTKTCCMYIMPWSWCFSSQLWKVEVRSRNVDRLLSALVVVREFGHRLPYIMQCCCYTSGIHILRLCNAIHQFYSQIALRYTEQHICLSSCLFAASCSWYLNLRQHCNEKRQSDLKMRSCTLGNRQKSHGWGFIHCGALSWYLRISPRLFGYNVQSAY